MIQYGWNLGVAYLETSKGFNGGPTFIMYKDKPEPVNLFKWGEEDEVRVYEVLGPEKYLEKKLQTEKKDGPLYEQYYNPETKATFYKLSPKAKLIIYESQEDIWVEIAPRSSVLLNIDLKELLGAKKVPAS
jgi:hypothetical protein